MGRKKISENNDTVTITVRNVDISDWENLSDYIGGRTKSEFIRDCIKNQIGMADTVSELKKEISEIEYEISFLQEKLSSKKKELGKILQSQEENADNELMLDTIIKTILSVNNKHGGISESKIKSMVREDFDDCLPISKILHRLNEYDEINWVGNMLEVADVSKAYNPQEKQEEKPKEQTYDNKLKELSEKVEQWAGNKSNTYRKYTALEILEDDEYKPILEKRLENKGVEFEDLKEYISKEFQKKKK